MTPAQERMTLSFAALGNISATRRARLAHALFERLVPEAPEGLGDALRHGAWAARDERDHVRKVGGLDKGETGDGQR